MRTTLLFAAGSAALFLVGPAFAASAAGAAAPLSPPASSQADRSSNPAANTGAAADASASATATASSVTAGEPVKDNTGAVIGQIASVDTDASGQKLAVIKMGADQFRIETSKLGPADGAVTVNLTQAQITAQLHPASAPK